LTSLMRRSRKIPFANRKKFATVVDGYCELWYLQMLKRNEKIMQVDLQPEIPQKKKLNEQFVKVIELSKHYDKVFWIVDYDVITTETRLAKKGTVTPTQEFKKYISDVDRNYDNVKIIINHPCLEFWFLLHYEFTEKLYQNCGDATRQLKKYLPDYQKTAKYYTKQNNDIYLKLRPKLEHAISNAKKLKTFDFGQPNSAMTQMQFLFEIEEMISILKSK
jgi:hypothetical protein